MEPSGVSERDKPAAIANEPVIEGLRAQKNALATEYQEKLETFKPGYPAMVQIHNKIKEIDHQLAAEVQTIKHSLQGYLVGSKSQEEEMKKQIERLRGKFLICKNAAFSTTFRNARSGY